MNTNIINLWKNYTMATNLMLDAMGGTSNIVGEFAEKLVAEYYGGTQLTASSKSADVMLKDGTAIQVKARMPRQALTTSLGIIRTWDFDYLVVVLFADNGSVIKAIEMDVESAKSVATPNKLQNGWVITTTQSFLEHSAARDLTEDLNNLMGMPTLRRTSPGTEHTRSARIGRARHGVFGAEESVPVAGQVVVGNRSFGTHRREYESFQDFVKRTLRRMLEEKLIPQEELQLLQTKEYSQTALGLDLALIEMNSRKTIDGAGHSRYWAKPFAGKYYICSQWWKQKFDVYEPRFARWIVRIADLNKLSEKAAQ
jgi:hypothetical protein